MVNLSRVVLHHRGTEKKRLRLQYFEEFRVRRFGFQKGGHTAVECDKHTSPSQRERQQISIRHLLVAHQPPAKKRDIRPRQFVPFSKPADQEEFVGIRFG